MKEVVVEGLISIGYEGGKYHGEKIWNIIINICLKVWVREEIFFFYVKFGGVTETKPKNRRKETSTVASRGKPPLHYINEQFLDDRNEKTSFLYIGVHGVTI